MKYRILKLEPVETKSDQDCYLPLKVDDYQTSHEAAQQIAEEWAGQRTGRVAIVVSDRDTYRAAAQTPVHHEPGADHSR